MDVEEDLKGIISQGRKFVVNMRILGGKPIWMTVDNLNLAKRVVELIHLYIAALECLPADHPDVPDLLEELRDGEFKQVVLQALESDTATELLQPPAANYFTAAEVPEGTIRAKFFFCLMYRGNQRIIYG